MICAIIKDKAIPYGVPVKIIWNDPNNDWYNFRIICSFYRITNDKTEVYLWLQGIDSDEGDHHDGIPFTVSIDEISGIVVPIS